jgi:hypothetical protein
MVSALIKLYNTNDSILSQMQSYAAYSNPQALVSHPHVITHFTQSSLTARYGPNAGMDQAPYPPAGQQAPPLPPYVYIHVAHRVLCIHSFV